MNIKIPNLPSGKVKCVIVDANAPLQLYEYFDNNKIEYIKSLYLKNIIDAVSTHPDMQICNVCDGVWLCEPTTYEYYKNQLQLFGVKVTSGETSVGCNYPEDVAYNVVVTDDFFMHNVDFTDKKVLELTKNNGIRILNTKQGYTMCATCIIDENAVITDDGGVYRACRNNGIDCLLVDKDKILLGERNDGFFGGCCGMIDHKILLFCGDIKKHKCYKEIKEFADKYSVELVSAYEGPLVDIGSILPIVQE